jgi:hypothetical protein
MVSPERKGESPGEEFRAENMEKPSENTDETKVTMTGDAVDNSSSNTPPKKLAARNSSFAAAVKTSASSVEPKEPETKRIDKDAPEWLSEKPGDVPKQGSVPNDRNPSSSAAKGHTDEKDRKMPAAVARKKPTEAIIRNRTSANNSRGVPRKPAARRSPPTASPDSVPEATASEDDFVVVAPKLFGGSSDETNVLPSLTPPSSLMTDEDLEICQRLDEEYERALEEREIGYNARYDSVRQFAATSVIFMFLYMTLGTVFFTQIAGWDVHEALFFSIYTITTVGYGSDKDIPTTPGFQIYVIFYIFVGIATLTIMVAQVYQCIALEASRAQHRRDKAELARRSKDLVAGDGIMKSSHHSSDEGPQLRRTPSDVMMQWWGSHVGTGETWVDKTIRAFERTRRFLRDTQVGRALSSTFPFAGLILIGAVVVGPIEGWTVVESLYFACVSLTTVGYGDTIPQRKTSIWFCIFWLPFSVGFMSLYLTNVARFYIRLSDRNIQRLERHMRRRMQKAKQQAEKERAEALRRAYRGQDSGVDGGAEVSLGTPDEEDEPDGVLEANGKQRKSLARRVASQFGFEPLPDGEVSSNASDEQEFQLDTPEALEILGQQRRERILQESNYDADGKPRGEELSTMKDILRRVRDSVVTESDVGQSYGDTNDALRGRPESQYMSIKSTEWMSSATVRRRPLAKREKKPSFALRVLVQQRFAEIIAIEVAGFQSNIEIEQSTMSVTIDTLHRTAEKWLVPRRARKAFRSVAFEAIYFVGEHSLVTRGADALYNLNPFEFHGLFAPLLAAYGDADTMEGWLASTNVLADVDLRGFGSSRGFKTKEELVAARLKELSRRASSGDRAERHRSLELDERSIT